MNITFDMTEFNKAVNEIGGELDQIPFAMARSLNDAVEVTRRVLIEETWPSSMVVRNKSFMQTSLSTAGERATKKKLSVMIYDKKGRGNLLEHADGGIETPQKSSSLAVPSSAIASRRSGKGVPKSMRPSAIPGKFRKGDVLYQRVGKYQKATGKAVPGQKRLKGSDNRKLKLVYVLKKSVTVKKDVKFRETFEQSMFAEVRKAFSKRFDQAMSTRRK